MASSFSPKCRDFALGLALVFVTQTAQAQTPPAQPSPPAEPPRSGVPSLVLSPEVQKDLDLTQKQEAVIKRLASKSAERRATLAEAGAEGGELEAKKAATTDLERGLEAKVFKVLNKRQKERLAQLEMQRIGSLAVVRKDIATKLKLTSAQNKKIKAIVYEMREEMARSMPRLPDTPPEAKGGASDGAPAGKGGRKPQGSNIGQGGVPGGANPGGGVAPNGVGLAGEPIFGDGALGDFSFPAAGGVMPGGGENPAGGNRPNLDTPEYRAQISKMREAHAKLRASATKKIDELLTQEQKSSLEKMFGKPFDFSKIQTPGAP
jgi:Spy/CpxP family protein refolding chaperone